VAVAASEDEDATTATKVEAEQEHDTAVEDEVGVIGSESTNRPILLSTSCESLWVAV
jgi:hypothetical protein